MLSFHSLNEAACLERIAGQTRVYHYSYSNQFYGRCELRLRLERLPDGRPWIPPDGVSVESHEIRRGNLESLLHAAQRLLYRELARHPELLSPQPQLPNFQSEEPSVWLKPWRWTVRRILGTSESRAGIRLAR